VRVFYWHFSGKFFFGHSRSHWPLGSKKISNKTEKKLAEGQWYDGESDRPSQGIAELDSKAFLYTMLLLEVVDVYITRLPACSLRMV
jgi:hypothetical protein